MLGPISGSNRIPGVASRSEAMPRVARRFAAPDVVELTPAAVARLDIDRLVNERISTTAPGSAPNRMTAREKRAVSALIQAIVAGTTQLRINTRAAATYDAMNQPLPPFGPRTARLVDARMRDDLTRIAQTACGRELLRELAHAAHPTTIVVLGTRQPDLTALCAGPRNAGPATVYFTPGVSYARDDIYGPSDDPNAQFRPSHMALFHELGHALAVVRGCSAEGSVATDDNASEAGRVSLEEYRNIGLGRFSGLPLSENAYRAERRALAAAKSGAAPGDELLSPRVNYRGKPPKGGPIAIRSQAYVEQRIAMILDQSTAPIAIAWELTNGITVDRAVALSELARQCDATTASAVAAMLEQPRASLMADYTAWATRRS